VAPALLVARVPAGKGMATCLLYTRPPLVKAAPSRAPAAAALLACLALMASSLHYEYSAELSVQVQQTANELTKMEAR
jgi:hypothetical protein